MQARDGSAHHGEAAAGDLGGGLEVEPAVARSQVHVVEGLEVEYGRLAPAPHFEILILAAAVRDALVGQVGDAELQRPQILLQALQLDLGRLQALAQVGHFRQQRGDILAGRLGPADGPGPGVALVLQLLHPHLQSLALVLQRLDAPGVEP